MKLKMESALKVCSKCEKPYPATVEFFHVDRTKRDGLHVHCKSCQRDKANAWYAENTERQKNNSRNWSQTNSERVRTNLQVWYQANSERRRAEVRSWQQANPEKREEHLQSWLRQNPLYNTWRNMIDRCTNPNNNRWKYYGGANPPVLVCDRWLDPEHGYENFCADMGERPEGTTLGRFLDRGNYKPGNVSWQTRLEQGLERRKNNLLRAQLVCAAEAA
jgi:hypothetical protein